VRSALLLLPNAAFCFPLQVLNSRPATWAFAGPGRTGSHRFSHTRYDGIQPRVGFAYAIKPKTVLRGGE